MNKKLKQKGLNEYEIVIPMSDETVKSIKANAAKTILGASIAGIMMFGGQSAKAESISEPEAIIQTAETQNEAEKKELYLEIDKLMSFNKTARAENDEQKFAKRKIESANPPSVNSDEIILQRSARDEAGTDEGTETIATAGKGQSESNDEMLSVISGKKTDEESVLNNAENKKNSESEIASVDVKAAENQAEISKTSEESNGEKTASSEDDNNLETVSDAETENNKEEKVQAEETKAEEVIEATEATEDNTAEETSEVEAEEETTSAEEGQTEEKAEVSLDDFINNKGIEDLFNVDKIKTDAEENLEVEEGKTQEAQKAPGEETTEPNYADDEAKIKDYDEDNDYKKTDLQQGDTRQELHKDDDGEDAKDGFKFETSNPSPTSPSLTEYGYAIVIDKETGQRTYTLLYVTDTGRIAVNTGNKPMMEEGDKLKDGSPEVTYKPNEDGTVTAGGPQRNYEWVASEETLKHINDSGYTVIGMKDDYTKDNPGIKYFEGGSFTVVYKVNPWPNENDKLELMELSGEYRDKVFVQGQEIKTDVKVDNIDDNAKERIVGQVYNPVTGKVVPGASAYIDDQGYVHIKMPEGALKKDENGKYVVNEDSIFNTPDYKALQNLDVKFFARPRTNDEFTKIADDPLDPGTYLGPVAGTDDINHKGENVTIDKQGIDRYDHYNLIGTLKIDLDDTRYYDQHFKDGNQEDTSDITSSAVKPGVEFNVGIYEKEDPGKYDKSADDMNGAGKRGEAIGVLNMEFIDKLNEGKAEKDQWKVIVDPDDISKFSIIAPASAKAGDFAAIPVEYTYTNGSKDVHWFHFVVQDPEYNMPSYEVQVDFPTTEMKSDVTVTEDEKKNKPIKYTIDEDAVYKDDKGNIWDVSIDENTGKVTAKPKAKPEGESFDGGEKLQVPVTAHYEDTDETVETTAEFVLKEKSNQAPDYDAKAGKAGDKLESNVIVDDNNYDRKPYKYTIDQTEYKDNKGNTWTVSIDKNTGKVTATVPNAAEGETIDLDGTMINVPVTAHYKNEEGTEIATRKANVQFLGSGTEGTHEYTEELPFDTTIVYDPDFYTNYPDAKNNYKVVTEGEVGSKTTKLTIKDSKVVKEEEIKKTDPKNAVIKVGDKNYSGVVTHTEKVEVPFTVEYRYNPELKEGEMKTVREGTNGSYNLNYSQKIKNGQADGNAETSKTDEVAPVSKIIEIGSKPASDTITITKGVEYELDYSRKDGEPEVVEEGNDGVITIKTTRNPDTGEITITQEVTTEVKNKIIKIPAGTEGKHEYTEKIPFKYEIQYDENLKSGEYVIDVPGSEGSKTTTWNIVNSKVNGEPTVEVKDPVNAKIRVGKKDYTGEVKHTEKIETPFEVEYRYSDELEAGETKVIQKGEKGSYDLEYSQKIKNGQADGDPTTDKKNVVDAKKEIIVIGIKPVEKVVEKGYNTVYEYDETLEAGKMEEKTPGQKGKTTITTSYDKVNNKLVTEEETVDPTDRVVRIGIKPIEKETELPFETEYVYDKNMEAGKTEVTQEGKTGKAKITTFFNKETGKLETKIEREEPTKKIVKYGSNTEGKVVVESEKAYEIEIIEDPEMEAGKTEVVQEGKNGKVETTITIENSKEVGRDTMVVEEPTKKIIKVGTKNVCDIPEQPDKPEEPGTPDKPEEPGTPDKPEKPGEEKPEEPGTPDKPEEPGIPDKPEEPGKPEKPSVPGEPSVPETPSEPNGGGTTVTEEKPSEKEETPEEKSEKPEEKVEEKDEDSDVESKEDKVDEAEEVVEEDVKASEGNNDSDGGNENKRLPKTGDGVNRSLYAYMLGLMGSAMMAIGVKKKNKESLDEE